MARRRKRRKRQPTLPEEARDRWMYPLPGEVEAGAWEAFCLYRDLGASDRDRREVELHLGKSVEDWPERFAWAPRAAAYDARQDDRRRRRLERARQIREEREDYELLVGVRFLEAAAGAARHLAEHPEKVPARHAVALFDRALAALERGRLTPGDAARRAGDALAQALTPEALEDLSAQLERSGED